MGDSDLTRRELFATIGPGPPKAKTRSNPENDYDVIVIGGGFAGATAARDLGQSGLRVLLLEARNRLGGRTFTSRFADHRVEFGGTWIHWMQPNVWAEVTRYGLEVTESPASDFERFTIVRKDGTREEADPDRANELFNQGVDRFAHDAREYFPRPYDPLFVKSAEKLDRKSVEDRLNEIEITDRQRDMISGLLAVLVGADPSEASLTMLLRQYAAGGWTAGGWFDTLGRYKLVAGTAALIQALVDDSGAEVRLATPVKAVTRGARQVVVTTEDGEQVSATTCVVTVPVNTYDLITFDPGLSPVRAEIAKMGQVARPTKVYVKLRENIGRFAGSGDPSLPLSWLVTEYDDDDGTVVVCFGSRRELLDVNDGDAVRAAVHTFLPDVQIQAAAGYDWYADPYARSAWPGFRPGELTQHYRDLSHSEQNVFFAGTLSATGWACFIDGAVESGVRAARDVVRYLA